MAKRRKNAAMQEKRPAGAQKDPRDSFNSIRNLNPDAFKVPGSKGQAGPAHGPKSPEAQKMAAPQVTKDDSDLFLDLMTGTTPLPGQARERRAPATAPESPPVTENARREAGRARSRAAVAAARERAEQIPPPREEDLFNQAMQGVSQLQAKGRDMQPAVEPKPLPVAAPEDPLRDFLEGKIEFALEFTEEYIEGHVLGLDLLTVGKLRAGQFSPEAHLDLHGLSAEAARDALLGFFRTAYYKGQRTVLLVTGRGLNSPNGVGVLRSRVQDWLTQDPLKRVVLAFCTARSQDGGTGALYVLLRKFKKSGGKIRWDRVPDA